MANVEHPYDYRRAVLAENAKAKFTGANPNLQDITAQHAAAQGNIAAQDKALASDVAFADKKIAESDRQFMEKMAMDRQMLDTWAEQNKWATEIAVGNLGIQALGIPANLRTLEKQAASQQLQKDQWQQSYNLQEAANLRAAQHAEQLRRDQAAQHAEALSAIAAQRRIFPPANNLWQHTLPADDNTT